jgi:predicted dinucleotide-binding enzyme
MHATVRSCRAEAKSAITRMQLEAAAQDADISFLRAALSTAESVAEQTRSENVVRHPSTMYAIQSRWNQASQRSRSAADRAGAHHPAADAVAERIARHNPGWGPVVASVPGRQGPGR